MLITKNCRILAFNNFSYKYFTEKFYRKTTKDNNSLFSFHRALKIFSNQLFSSSYQLFSFIFLLAINFLSTWENMILKNFEKNSQNFMKKK